MKYIINLILISLLFVSCSHKERGATTRKIADTDKYRLIWNDDPQTTMTIAWNQNRGESYLRYGLNLDVNNSVSPSRKIVYRGMNNNFVKLKNLTSNSRYYFKICTQNECSQQMYFKTAPSKNKSFTFISGGDSRSIPKGRMRGNILVSKIRPLFIAHGGDFSMNGTTEEWKRWLDEWQSTKSSDGRMYPLIVTHGNHENADLEMLHKIFDIPNKDAYYKIDFNLLSLYTLNTEIEPYVESYNFVLKNDKKWKEQKKWLEKTLKKENKKWRIVSYHRPLRPHRKSKAEGMLRYVDWSPLFYKYGVQLAIESDSHLVKYTQPLKPNIFGEEGFVVDKKRGTTFIGEGSWGAPTRKNDDDKSWTIDSGQFWQFKHIVVNKESLEIRTVKFGDEKTDYNANIVREISQAEQNKSPKILPHNLDLWESKIGKVLMII